MASVNHRNAGRRKSSVWDHFHLSGSGAAGARAMATCNRCGTTLQASSKKHGTSHLRRHSKSSCCAKRAAERDAKWVDELLVEPEFDVAGRLVVQAVDELLDDGGHGNFIPDALPLPQAPSSSSTRFFRKKRQRSGANLASRGETTAGDDDHSSGSMDWLPTVDDNFLLNMDFNFEDGE